MYDIHIGGCIMKMKASVALAKVLKSWGVDHVYGITADSINNMVDGLYQERDEIKYIQVRHEEVGALAANADTKLTGTIGVSFASAGPGAVHLLNGLYDAKADHTPVLALVGQAKTEFLNTNFFQEFNEDPMFIDVSVFHQQVVSAAQIPYVVDQAIRAAYAKKGPAVVILPDDLSGEEIDFVPFKTDKISHINAQVMPEENKIAEVVSAINESKRPILYIGQGLSQGKDALVKLSEKLGIPVVSTVLGTGIIPTDHPNFMGSMGRLGTKAAYEVVKASDLIIFIGANYPFARLWPDDAKIIQVNNNLSDLGKQRDADITIPADATLFVEALVNEDVRPVDEKWLLAARQDKRLWDEWLLKLANDDSQGLRAENVINAIKENSLSDSIFALDVGNNTEWSIRQLPFNQQQKFTISALYATMGYALPASIAAKLSYPGRQVYSISGDGGFAMVMQDLLTQVKYDLPIVNVVLENKSLGFIAHEKFLLNQYPYGIDLLGAKWSEIAKNMGAIAFEVDDIRSLKKAFEEINALNNSGNKRPIVIDAKILDKDPIDTSFMPLNSAEYSGEQIGAYRDRYELGDMPTLQDILKEM